MKKITCNNCQQSYPVGSAHNSRTCGIEPVVPTPQSPINVAHFSPAITSLSDHGGDMSTVDEAYDKLTQVVENEHALTAGLEPPHTSPPLPSNASYTVNDLITLWELTEESVHSSTRSSWYSSWGESQRDRYWEKNVENFLQTCSYALKGDGGSENILKEFFDTTMNKVGKEYPIKSHFSEKPDTAFAVALFQRMREEWSVWGVNQNETNAFRENCWKVVPHLIPHLSEQTMKGLVDMQAPLPNSLIDLAIEKGDTWTLRTLDSTYLQTEYYENDLANSQIIEYVIHPSKRYLCEKFLNEVKTRINTLPPTANSYDSYRDLGGILPNWMRKDILDHGTLREKVALTFKTSIITQEEMAQIIESIPQPQPSTPNYEQKMKESEFLIRTVLSTPTENLSGETMLDLVTKWGDNENLTEHIESAAEQRYLDNFRERHSGYKYLKEAVNLIREKKREQKRKAQT